jgi:hypothetical protein
MPYIPGEPWYICDICGLKGRRSDMVKNWKGQMVHKASCYESRHPQDFPAPSVSDQKAVRDVRPEQEYNFVSPGEVTPDDL